MAYLGSWKIDDLVTFAANTHGTDGVAADADAAPSYRVYEDETATPILTGTMALLDSANTTGFYTEQITLSAANGFEKGKSYTIYVEATVSSNVGTMSHTLQIEAEVDANVVSDKSGYSISGTITTLDGLNDPTAAAVAVAVWDALQSAHVTAGSFGEIATEIADILADTNELQTDDVPGLIAALNDLSAAEVNAEVVDVMATDTHALPGQGAPPLTPTYKEKLGYLYKTFRNAKKQSDTEFQILADDETTVDHKAAVDTTGGVTTVGELATGP